MITTGTQAVGMQAAGMIAGVGTGFGKTRGEQGHGDHTDPTPKSNRQRTSAAGLAGVGVAQRSNVDTLQRLLCGRSIPVVMTVLTAVGTAACTVAVVSL